jgi:RNA recognition motif-containing protein
MSTRLYVGNMSYTTTEMDLRDLFAAAGTVTDVRVMLDRETGRPRGFAFVEMSSSTEAQAAIAQCDGREFGGRALKVNQAEERGAGGRGGSSRARW